jgi:hypothetical protein
MQIFYWVLAAIMLFVIVMQVRLRIPRIISFFSPNRRDLFFQDVADPPVDELHQEMIKPKQEQLSALGYTYLGLMVEKAPLWAKPSRELVLVSEKDKIIASIGFRGLKMSYFLYTPFEGGEVVITAHDCFRNFVKPDFITTEVKSDNLEEMIESHKKDVADFEAKGYVAFTQYNRESVIRATNQYYQSPYPSKQLRTAGFVNTGIFVFSLLVLYLLVNAALQVGNGGV